MLFQLSRSTSLRLKKLCSSPRISSLSRQKQHSHSPSSLIGRLPGTIIALIIDFAWTRDDFTLTERTKFFLTSHLVSTAYTQVFDSVFYANVHLLTPSHLSHYFDQALRRKASQNSTSTRSITAHFSIPDLKDTALYTKESKVYKKLLSSLVLKKSSSSPSTRFSAAYHLDSHTSLLEKNAETEIVVIYTLTPRISWDVAANERESHRNAFWSRVLPSCTSTRETPSVEWSKASTVVIDVGSESDGVSTLVAEPLKDCDDFDAFSASFQLMSVSHPNEYIGT